MEEDMVMKIEKPHFIVKLWPTLLEVDMKEGVKKELEDLVEARPALRDSVGLLFQTIVPVDVPLKDIASVGLDKKGTVKVEIPLRRDLHIPLDATEAQGFIVKLNELIAREKERVLKDKQEAERAAREAERTRAPSEKELSGAMFKK